MADVHTESMTRLIEQFKTLPGIGARSAERIAYHLLKQSVEEVMPLAEAIRDVKTRIRFCERCYNLSEQPLCSICRDSRRDHGIVCVVEQPQDLIALEETGLCNWSYHVLLGRIAPLEGMTPETLTIDALVERVKQGGIRELVMATNPTIDGDGTTLYLASILESFDIRISRLARGLPSGGSIEQAGKSILRDAILGRSELP